MRSANQPRRRYTGGPTGYNWARSGIRRRCECRHLSRARRTNLGSRKFRSDAPVIATRPRGNRRGPTLADASITPAIERSVSGALFGVRGPHRAQGSSRAHVWGVVPSRLCLLPTDWQPHQSSGAFQAHLTEGRCRTSAAPTAGSPCISWSIARLRSSVRVAGSGWKSTKTTERSKVHTNTRSHLSSSLSSAPK
jgi:hypothetical protein